MVRPVCHETFAMFEIELAHPAHYQRGRLINGIGAQRRQVINDLKASCAHFGAQTHLETIQEDILHTKRYRDIKSKSIYHTKLSVSIKILGVTFSTPQAQYL